MESYIEKNSNRDDLSSLLPLDMPLGLCVEPASICNFKCIQCPISLPDFKRIVGDTGLLAIELFRKIAFDIKAMGRLKQLNLYGDGEPLLNKSIVDMVRIANDNNIAEKITITTNAALLTEKLSEALIDSGLTYLRVSVYSVYDERFKEVAGVKNIDPQVVFNNVKRFREIRERMGVKKPYIYVKMIDTYSNENDDFAALYKDIADQVNIETPMNWNGYDGIDFISKVDTEKLTDETLIQGFYAEKGKSGLKKICTTPFHSLNIKMNGDVVVCIVDWNKGTKVGNINEQSLSEIWFGDNLRHYREMHLRGERYKTQSCKNSNYLYCNLHNIAVHSDNY